LFIDGGQFKFLGTETPIPRHPVEDGAVKSLASGDIVPLTIFPGGWNGLPYGVPTHAVVGHLPSVIPDFTAVGTGVMSKEMWYLQNQVAGFCGLSREVVFGPIGGKENSDGLVPVSSQLGSVGLYDAGQLSTDVSSVDHVSVLGKEDTVKAVKDLLEGKMDRFKAIQ
jgi:hypothetical protein